MKKKEQKALYEEQNKKTRVAVAKDIEEIMSVINNTKKALFIVVDGQVAIVGGHDQMMESLREGFNFCVEKGVFDTEDIEDIFCDAIVTKTVNDFFASDEEEL